MTFSGFVFMTFIEMSNVRYVRTQTSYLAAGMQEGRNLMYLMKCQQKFSGSIFLTYISRIEMSINEKSNLMKSHFISWTKDPSLVFPALCFWSALQFCHVRPHSAFLSLYPD